MARDAAAPAGTGRCSPETGAINDEGIAGAGGGCRAIHELRAIGFHYLDRALAFAALIESEDGGLGLSPVGQVY